MKKILFFVLALTVIFSCGRNKKKKDDPQPDNKTATTEKNITIYVTRHAFYPNSTDYYFIDSTYLITGSTIGSYKHKNNSSDRGPREFTNVGDSTYTVSFQTASNSGAWYGYPGYGGPVPSGEYNVLISDSIYIHTVYK